MFQPAALDVLRGCSYVMKRAARVYEESCPSWSRRQPSVWGLQAHRLEAPNAWFGGSKRTEEDHRRDRTNDTLNQTTCPWYPVQIHDFSAKVHNSFQSPNKIHKILLKPTLISQTYSIYRRFVSVCLLIFEAIAYTKLHFFRIFLTLLLYQSKCFKTNSLFETLCFYGLNTGFHRKKHSVSRVETQCFMR